MTDISERFRAMVFNHIERALWVLIGRVIDDVASQERFVMIGHSYAFGVCS